MRRRTLGHRSAADGEPRRITSRPMSPGARGVFVAFEGGEGAGKSTLLRGLAVSLRVQGREVTTTREPGATAVGARLRELLLDPASAGLDPRAEALLYAADRADHVARVVRPALRGGTSRALRPLRRLLDRLPGSGAGAGRAGSRRPLRLGDSGPAARPHGRGWTSRRRSGSPAPGSVRPGASTGWSPSRGPSTTRSADRSSTRPPPIPAATWSSMRPGHRRSCSMRW